MDGAPAFSVQADPSEQVAWAEFARQCEQDGFEGLLVADHPGTGSAPFVALAAAAIATERLRLGSYVVNAGAWEPVRLASEVATLDLVSGGRALLGAGAGHTPAEWTMAGRDYPPARDRVARMREVVEVTHRLLAGEVVSFTGDHVTVREAVIESPLPVQDAIPLLVGGNGRAVLRFAAERADIVGFSGLGRTLEDGHRHEVRWKRTEIDERVELVTRTCAALGRHPVHEALVQHLEVTDDAEGAARRLAERVPTLTADDVLEAPYVLIGAIPELVSELRAHERRWGFNRFVVRASAREDAARLLAAVSGS